MLARICIAATAVIVAGLPVSGAPLCPGLFGVQPAPPALQARIAQAFGIAAEAARNSVVRCDGARLLACAAGANLNCGFADMRRELPGATEYCKANAEADFIPMFATGHATIYNWRCSGGHATPGKVVVTVDPQGYDAGNWKEAR